MATTKRGGAAAVLPRRRNADKPFQAQRWQFEKRLSVDTFVGIIGVALVIGGPILVWGRAMESRVQVLEVVNVERSRADEKTAAEAREQRQQMASRLDKIDGQVTQMLVSIGQLTTQIVALTAATQKK